MPLTATLEEIKAHMEKIEKNKISPHHLPNCPFCNLKSVFFKLHAYRERRFLILVDMVIRAVCCALVRFRCPGCNKTFTHYPDFAIPHKHYTRQTIMRFAGAYVESDGMTYEWALMVDGSVPAYQDGRRSMAASTIHRWIATLGGFHKTSQRALDLLTQKNPTSSICRYLAQITVPRHKYKTRRRKALLMDCFRLSILENFFHSTFELSIFTKLALHCAFS